MQAGNAPLLDLPLRLLTVALYGALTGGLDDEARRRVDNLLSRLPGAETPLVEGVPIPAWFDDADLPPSMRPKGWSGVA